MEMQIKKIENYNLNYRGQLETSFLNLKIVFGDPTFVNTKDSTFIWIVQDDNNRVYRIYDFKINKSWYPDSSDLAEFESWNWRVDASSSDSYKALATYFNESLSIID